MVNTLISSFVILLTILLVAVYQQSKALIPKVVTFKILDDTSSNRRKIYK